MTGIARCLTKILVLSVLALAVAASTGTAASPTRAPILGAVPHANRPLRAAQAQSTPDARSKLPTVSAAGKFLGVDANYETLINRYLADVAHDSGDDSNVYSVATQYSDSSGPIQYQSTFGGSYVDHDPLPASGCNDKQDSVCLTDEQLQTEIQHVLTAQGWHGSTSNLFFIMTPDGVGSCFTAADTECSTNFYCAYHNDFTDSQGEPVIYANEPYQATIPGCSSGSSPNGDDADTTINTISHEQNEAISDPFGDAWWANDGSEDEMADLCAWTFGTASGSGTTMYNQVINGDHYWLQQEYSNAADGCVQNLGGPASPPVTETSGLVYHGGQVMHTNTTYAIYWLPTPRNTARPTVSGTAAVKRTLASTRGSWSGSPDGYKYQWQRCSSATAGCTDISGATRSKYTVQSADRGEYVRSTVSAENVNGFATSVASAGAQVVSSPRATKGPDITGHPSIGRRLAASRGAWSGPPKTYSFQWLRCNARGSACVAIGGATHKSYRPTQRDAGHRLRVRVTAANVVGRATATSRATVRVSASGH
jgi:hypothetical protein